MTTKTIVRRCFAPALALTLFASAGCKKTGEDADREAARSGESQLDTSKRQAGQAYDQAKEAQEAARDKTGEAMQKGEDVMKQREELTEAQREMQQKQQEAQQAQQKAQQQAQSAQQQGQQAQQQAAQDQQAREQQLQQQGQAAQQQDSAQQDKSETTTTTTTTETTGANTANGTIETSSQDELVIRRSGGQTLRLDVDPQATTVVMDGRPAAITDLQQGSKVKVSYRTERGQSVATRIEVGKTADEG